MHQLLESLPGAVVVYDATGAVVKRNEAAAWERARADHPDHPAGGCGPACAYLHADAIDPPSVATVTVAYGVDGHLTLDRYGDAEAGHGFVAVTPEPSAPRSEAPPSTSLQDALATLATALLMIQECPDARQALCDAALLVTGSAAVVLLEAGLDDAQLTVTRRAGPDADDLAAVDPATHLAHRALALGRFVIRPPFVSAGRQTASRVYFPVPVSAGCPAAVLCVVLDDASGAEVPVLPVLDIVVKDAAQAVQRQQLLVQVRSDPLTGLANRRRWDEELQREMNRGVRLAAPVTVALLDFDHFKAYNDLYGHARGDQLLQRVATAWSVQLRSTDVLARLGGEEFGLLLPGCDTLTAAGVVRKLLDAMPPGTTSSAGVAGWQGQDPDAFLQAADRALYRAKAEGRNRVAISRPSDEEPAVPPSGEILSAVDQ